ncbi:hypothetical protein PHYPSEUDO_002979 [Phytophthora pseudosyringae]|uniref:6-phosphogluconolactonase n=1 Tax=Phytophthora pseudosyringae TaxID=221518 RepID=A0A8T1VWX4_9STRA|nr:hypothetical protein PHYPSEUDO_002979 [Phytophthora pseudosyringae]
MHLPSFLFGFVAGVVNALVEGIEQSAPQPILFAATHTRNEGWMVGTGKGVYTYKFDTADGTLAPFGVTPVGVNPVFVQGSVKKFSGGKPLLYAVNAVTDASKTDPGTQTGYVSALTLRSNGTLELLNTLESHGGNPTHISLSPNEDFVVISNYDGSLAMFPLNADGSLANESFHQGFPTGSKVVMDQQAVGHIHSTTWVPTRTMSSLLISGVTSCSSNFAYVVDEISNTVGVFEINKDTALLPSTAAQNTTTLTTGFTNTSTAADVHLSSDGKFLYASNRGHNSIAIFVVHETDGTLSSLGWESSRGKTPKSLVVYGDWMVVANQDSDSMHVFKRSQSSGLLTYTGKTYEVGTPERVYIGIV